MRPFRTGGHSLRMLLLYHALTVCAPACLLLAEDWTGPVSGVVHGCCMLTRWHARLLQLQWRFGSLRLIEKLTESVS
jgi:hypothetical protein